MSNIKIEIGQRIKQLRLETGLAKKNLLCPLAWIELILHQLKMEKEIYPSSI